MRQYSADLTPPWKKPKPVPEVAAEPGLVVEEPGTGFCGAVIRCEAGTVTLEDRFGKHRVFPLEPRGFLLEGRVGRKRIEVRLGLLGGGVVFNVGVALGFIF